MLKRLSLLTILLGLVFAMSSCHTSRNAVPKQNPPKQQATISKNVNTKKLKNDEKKLVEEAMTWLGTPYRYGGQDYSGTDCSGMTMKVYHKALGIKIPRNSAEQQRFCRSINKKSMNAGDLLFFCTGKDKNRVSHVGLYIGDGRFIHASASRGVIISHIDERYYASNYHSSGFVQRKGYSTPTETKPATKKTKAAKPKDAKKATETTPLKFELPANRQAEIELDRAIENQIDSIYTSFFD